MTESFLGKLFNKLTITQLNKLLILSYHHNTSINKIAFIGLQIIYLVKIHLYDLFLFVILVCSKSLFY